MLKLEYRFVDYIVFVLLSFNLYNNFDFLTKGSQINIYHSVKSPIKANVENRIVIPLYEVRFNAQK